MESSEPATQPGPGPRLRDRVADGFACDQPPEQGPFVAITEQEAIRILKLQYGWFSFDARTLKRPRRLSAWIGTAGTDEGDL